MDDYVKRRLTSFLTPKKKLSESIPVVKKQEYLDDGKVNQSQDPMRTNIIIVENDSKEEDKITEHGAEHEQDEKEPEQKSIKSEEIKFKPKKRENVEKSGEKKLDDGEEEEPIEIVVSQIISKSDSNVKDKYFGELFDEQSDRLRKISPYGNLKTWKIFKIIGIYNIVIN